MLKKSLRTILKLLYRVEVVGLENYYNAGNRVLIVANHCSFLDPPLLAAFLPDEITFAINTHIAGKWWMKPFLGLATVFLVDPTHPMSLKNLIHYLQHDTKVLIFPEGRITTTGSLMKIYDGTGMVADKSDAMILPIQITGAKYTPFSKLSDIQRLRWFPRITLTILPPTHIQARKELSGKNRRKSSGHILADLMADMQFISSPTRQTIFASLLNARHIHGGKHFVAEDLERKPLSYDALITRTLIIGHALQKITEPNENVGVLLPNSSKTLCVLLGLQQQQRVPAMLNYSTGAGGMIAACKTAQIKTVLSSRKFVELANLKNDMDSLSEKVDVIYLEDLAETISTLDKLRGAWQSKTAQFWHKNDVNPDSSAVILFTSGSEGTPKGVVLSHANILSNHQQVSARIDFNPQDVILNFLPMFHSFGFTVGTLLPVLNGMKTFFYPTPLHFSIIPEMAYETNATIMFGTNTFLAAYGKKAHPYDFYKLRYVVAGAEKLQNSTRELWSEKFGVRILEGYGATETAPVAAVNTPMDYKVGTVGRLLPHLEYRLEPVEGIDDAGRLHLRGANIMLGYLLADNAGKLQPTESIYGAGWYDTGDIVHIDDDGFLSIRGRCKRFAKIGGEMVSLPFVEQLVMKAWEKAHHAVISLPDAKKGEKIILITTQKDATLRELASVSDGVAAINLPKKILFIDTIPVMATGKTDYVALTTWCLNQL
ncbi:MAG: acyl-[ACP]--phospholipid O-acyltransferase [Methylococcaceae bacterium]|nr:acyl-[ACP]--phospholipid O-acyltransferase [Methylococcaceae bacterium]